ncbi:MAG: hypothetical protein Q4D31_01300 [Eubacteriales bacterium]|nr:hypothetical protein [Eubacteriales bacterium]
MKRPLPDAVMAATGVAVWLSACGLLTWVVRAYDGAIVHSAAYFWAYGGAILLFGLCSDHYADEVRPDQTPRWVGALLLLLGTWVLYYQIDHRAFVGWRYDLYLWWLALGLLPLGTVCLYQNSRFRRPQPPRRPRSSLYNASVSLLLCFAPLLAATPLYLAVLRPVTVDAITPIGEAEGGRFIGHVPGDPAAHPLGLYFFADDDRWYYYDVRDGAPVAYRDPFDPT